MAHSSPSSNSGNLAPRTLFPPDGLVPDKDHILVVIIAEIALTHIRKRVI